MTLRDVLCISALAQIIGIEEADVRGSLNRLHSVILVPPSPDESPRVFHKSVADFLISRARCDEEGFWIDAPNHEAFLVHRCLEIMEESLKANMAKIEDPTLENGEVDGFDERVKTTRLAPVRYACLYWVSHLAATEHMNSQIQDLLRDFLCHHLLHWMEAIVWWDRFLWR